MRWGGGEGGGGGVTEPSAALPIQPRKNGGKIMINTYTGTHFKILSTHVAGLVSLALVDERVGVVEPEVVLAGSRHLTTEVFHCLL